VTNLGDRSETVGEVVQFRLRTPPEPQDELELADQPPAVRQLHHVDTPGTDLEPAGPVYEAELVDDDQAPAGGLVRRQVVVIRQLVQPVVVVVRTVRQHEPTVRTSKAAGRQLVYVFTGLAELLKRYLRHRTRYERLIRSAEAAGDREAMLEWEARGEQAKERRHKRRMDLLKLPYQVARGLAVSVVVAVVVLLLLGLVALHEGAGFLDPLQTALDVIWWLAAAVSWIVGWLMVLGPVLVIGLLWQVGRTSNANPAWLLAPKQAGDHATATVTADAIVVALQHMSISKLDKAFKDGWIPPFELPPTREGQGQFKGYRAIFGLPEGVTPGQIADKREVFAANLSRIGMEVWPADYGQERGGRARHVNLYVADRGVMDKPTPTYPLMHDGAADVFEGVPIGITQRGDTVLMPLNGSNCIFGGLPGQGKSNGVRVVFAGAALDPLAELRVHVFAGNGDFDAYERRLSRYQKGASPEHAEAATLHLAELLAEVERREKRLAELGAKKLTRPIAQQHPDMRPLIVGFSECHELFGDKDNGEEAADLAIRVVKRGRKTGVILIFDTQSSRANAIPSQLVENMGVNCCYCVKTWRNNDGFLGDGSFAAGIRATELRFNIDRGTMLATGLTEELFEIVRTYFIEVDDDRGWDAATEIIDRAMQQLDPQTPAHGERTAPVVETSRDLLDDVAKVIGDQTVPAADVPALLSRQFPDWSPYRRITGKKLVQQLDELGFKVPKTGNRWPIRPAKVREARERRS
jgi:S-DNA-T family DNA segregation ATPase FtsK/SpoIIIE